MIKTENYPTGTQGIKQVALQKNEINNAIYVVNASGYNGKSTQSEIDCARYLNKETLFLEPANKF